MKTDFLKDLGLDDDVIQKIQAEAGKSTEKEKSRANEFKETINELNGQLLEATEQISNLEKELEETQGLKDEVENYRAQEQKRLEEEKQQKEEEAYKTRFEKVTKDYNFVNEMTKAGIYSEFKAAIKDNSEESDEDSLKALIKDREGILANLNNGLDIPGVKSIENLEITREQFEKMGYSGRVKLKKENPDLYASLRQQN